MVRKSLCKNIVYKIINNITGDFYIGSSIKFNLRIDIHKRKLRANKHHSPILQNSWNKYGERSFSVEIVERVQNKELLISREQYWLDTLRPKFNCCKTAGSPMGVKRSLKTRRKISEKLKEYFKNNTHCNTGRKFSEELKHKFSTARKGKTMEVCNHKKECGCFICKAKRGEAIGEKASNYGKKHSLETKAKLREKRLLQKSPMLGKHLSEEAKLKIRDKLMIPIIQYSKDGCVIKKWKGTVMAAKTLDLRPTNINSCLKKKTKSCGGFIWEYE